MDYQDGAFALPLDESAQHERVSNGTDYVERQRAEDERDRHEQVEREPNMEIQWSNTDIHCVEHDVNDAAGGEEIQILPDGISLEPASSAQALGEPARSSDGQALQGGRRQNGSSAFGLRVAGQDLVSAKARQQLDVRRRGAESGKRKTVNRYHPDGRKFVGSGQVRASSALTNSRPPA